MRTPDEIGRKANAQVADRLWTHLDQTLGEAWGDVLRSLRKRYGDFWAAGVAVRKWGPLESEGPAEAAPTAGAVYREASLVAFDIQGLARSVTVLDAGQQETNEAMTLLVRALPLDAEAVRIALALETGTLTEARLGLDELDPADPDHDALWALYEHQLGMRKAVKKRLAKMTSDKASHLGAALEGGLETTLGMPLLSWVERRLND